MENSLTFREAHGGMTAQYHDTRGVRRNAVKIGRGGQTAARAHLIAWAKEDGWNG